MNLTVTNVGRFGKPIEVREITKADNNKTAVINNSIAINTGKDKTVWIDVEIWGDSFCNHIKEYFSDGKAFLFSGHLDNRKKTYYKKASEETFESTYVMLILDNIEFLPKTKSKED